MSQQERIQLWVFNNYYFNFDACRELVHLLVKEIKGINKATEIIGIYFVL